MFVNMTDFDDIGREPNRASKSADDAVSKAIAKATKPLIEKSSLERAAEGMRSPLERLAAVDSSFAKLAAVSAPLERLAGLKTALSGFPASSVLKEQMRQMEKAQEHMKLAFGPDILKGIGTKLKVSDDVARAIELAQEVRAPERTYRPTLPKIPPNPVYKTNEHLKVVGEKIDALLDVQAQQAQLIDMMLKSQVEGGKTQARFALWGTVIGFLGLLVAVITLALAFKS